MKFQSCFYSLLCLFGWFMGCSSTETSEKMPVTTLQMCGETGVFEGEKLLELAKRQIILIFCDSANGKFTLHASHGNGQFTAFEYLDTLPEPDIQKTRFKIRNKATGEMGEFILTNICGAEGIIDCGVNYYMGSSLFLSSVNAADILKNKMTFNDVYYDALQGEYLDEATGERLYFSKINNQFQIAYSDAQNQKQQLSIIPNTHFKVYFENDTNNRRQLEFANYYGGKPYINSINLETEKLQRFFLHD